MAAAILQKELGITSIPHFTCRDRSLLGTQADLLGANALGIRCLLPTTGDGPQTNKLIEFARGLLREQ